MLLLSSKEIARLWANITVAGPDECWLWTAATRGGKNFGWYGAFQRGRPECREQNSPRNFYAHRVMFCAARGWPLNYLTDDLAVMHTCDNSLCCNPAHLELGTQLCNIRDMIAKKRNAVGSKISRKLCEARVRTIKERLQAGDEHGAIAADFGVVRSTISLIAAGRTWAWVQPLEIPI